MRVLEDLGVVGVGMEMLWGVGLVGGRRGFWMGELEGKREERFFFILFV